MRKRKMLADDSRPGVALPVPREYRRGMLRRDERVSVSSGLKLLDLIDARKPIKDAKILDMGCGVKVAQALVERGSPQSLYIGVDVYREMIEYLQNALAEDSRYRFEVANFHNDKYNRDGVKMRDVDGLPIEPMEFDILTMFSVITHMLPEDAEDVLKKLRKHAAGDAVLIFSTFVSSEQQEEFVDVFPEKPLFKASFRKDYLESIIERAGWTVREFHPAIQKLINNFYVCAPG
jgi:SAM-dependent methyltransferase